ncbi:MAG: HRDC domain-containing protein, partial [Treponemataceae bacterium]|nr:HRDC domain-containing protein [Treponemataceae bacterium]
QTTDDLLMITGIGESKAEKFGAAILRVIRENAE